LERITNSFKVLIGLPNVIGVIDRRYFFGQTIQGAKWPLYEMIFSIGKKSIQLICKGFMMLTKSFGMFVWVNPKGWGA
jgi:hypothetical protein